MQDRLCFCLFKVLGAHKALVASSAGAYGRSDGLPHSLLSPSYSWLPPPSFFLLPAVAVLWGNEWASCLLRSHLTLTNSTMHLVCMCALGVHVDLSDWLWDLRCVFEKVFVWVCLARSFSTLHAGLEQADKLFAKTGN